MTSLKQLYPFYIGKKAIVSQNNVPVVDKYSKKVSTHVTIANKEEINDAINKTYESQNAMRDLPNYVRKDILLDIASQIRSRSEELSRVLVYEVGKTINDARMEVSRAVDTFTIAAEESVRKTGDFSPLDISKKNHGYSMLASRFPVGLVSFIVPFNFPINLAAHKIAPAIAVGNPFVLKPSEKTPISASILGEILSNTDLPDNSFAMLPCNIEEAPIFSKNDKINLVSFTGSPLVGWKIKADAGKKRVLLELGGNAAVVIDTPVSIDKAVERVSIGAFGANGQSCISVQRIFIQENIYNEFVEKFINKAKQLVVGDPINDKTNIGPLIDDGAVNRLSEWIGEAVSKGGKVLLGGKTKETNVLEPTIISDVPHNCHLQCNEAFGPVCVVEKYTKFEDVINLVNSSSFGLQAGVFTSDIHKAFYAYKYLHVGGVIINDVPTTRIDSMPYGGIKDSGLGREGVRYAMDDMSELKIMVMKEML